jgi:hypothetical protein
VNGEGMNSKKQAKQKGYYANSSPHTYKTSGENYKKQGVKLKKSMVTF